MAVTREQALRELGQVVAATARITSKLTPLEAAQRAWHPGGPPVDVLAAQIAADRAQRLAELGLDSTGREHWLGIE